MALRCLSPGLPDTYQGTEFWDFSLVDPDNRRPVEFALRKSALAEKTPVDLLATTWRDGRIKQALLHNLLTFRRDEPALFLDGSYEPLEVTGPRSRNVLAFLRRHEGRAALVIIARLIAKGLTADALIPDAAWVGRYDPCRIAAHR